MISTGLHKRQVQRLLCAGIIAASLWLPGDSGAQNGNGHNGLHGDGLAPYEKYNVEAIPSGLIRMDAARKPYVFLIDKAEQRLYIYAYEDNYHLVRSFSCSTGENNGNKKRSGDKKTPEGIYFFTRVMEIADLNALYGRSTAAQYGVRAFDTDYPNPVDAIYKRRGYGIWMHGTDKPERAELPYSTRGCIVLRNDDIETITSLVSLDDTPVIMEDHITYVPRDSLDAAYRRVMDFLQEWRASWEKRDFASYDACYAPVFRTGGKNRRQWLSYKRQVLNAYEWVTVAMQNVRIFRTGAYFYVEYDQKFRSDAYEDFGKKRLYIEDASGRFRIIHENWSPLPGN